MGGLCSMCNPSGGSDFAPPQMQRNTIFTMKNAAARIKVESGTTVTGDGTVLAGTPISQDRCYWELQVVAIPAGGEIRLGVSRKQKKAKSAAPKVAAAAAGKAEGKKKAVAAAADPYAGHFGPWSLSTKEIGAEAGDTIGILFDQCSGPTHLQIFRQGKKVGKKVKGIKGAIYPAVSISGGAKVKANFAVDASDFKFPPPAGVEGIIPARGVI
jgi:hypothetical protein